MAFSSIDIRNVSLDSDIGKHLPEMQHPYLDEYTERLAGVLIPEQQVQEGVENCARAMAEYYLNEGINTITPLYVLIGARKSFGMLESALFRYGLRTIEDRIGISRYGASIAGGTPRIKVPEAVVIPGDDALIVEDVFDEGKTLDYTSRHLEMLQLNSLNVFTLLFKPGKYQGKIRIQWPAFKIDDHWVVGMGMDLSGSIENGKIGAGRVSSGRPIYRCLPFIAVAKPQYLFETGQITEKQRDDFDSRITFM